MTVDTVAFGKRYSILCFDIGNSTRYGEIELSRSVLGVGGGRRWYEDDKGVCRCVLALACEKLLRPHALGAPLLPWPTRRLLRPCACGPEHARSEAGYTQTYAWYTPGRNQRGHHQRRQAIDHGINHLAYKLCRESIFRYLCHLLLLPVGPCAFLSRNNFGSVLGLPRL